MYAGMTIKIANFNPLTVHVPVENKVSDHAECSARLFLLAGDYSTITILSPLEETINNLYFYFRDKVQRESALQSCDLCLGLFVNWPSSEIGC